MQDNCESKILQTPYNPWSTRHKFVSTLLLNVHQNIDNIISDLQELNNPSIVEDMKKFQSQLNDTIETWKMVSDDIENTQDKWIEVKNSLPTEQCRIFTEKIMQKIPISNLTCKTQFNKSIIDALQNYFKKIFFVCAENTPKVLDFSENILNEKRLSSLYYDELFTPDPWILAELLENGFYQTFGFLLKKEQSFYLLANYTFLGISRDEVLSLSSLHISCMRDIIITKEYANQIYIDQGLKSHRFCKKFLQSSDYNPSLKHSIILRELEFYPENSSKNILRLIQCKSTISSEPHYRYNAKDIDKYQAKDYLDALFVAHQKIKMIYISELTSQTGQKMPKHIVNIIRTFLGQPNFCDTSKAIATLAKNIIKLNQSDDVKNFVKQYMNRKRQSFHERYPTPPFQRNKKVKTHTDRSM